MTRGGTDMATYTTPRTPGTRRPPPGPAAPPGRPAPPGPAIPPGRPAPPNPGRGAPSGSPAE